MTDAGAGARTSAGTAAGLKPATVAVREEIVRFPTAEGKLFGILHLPEKRKGRLAVVFCNAGLQNRAGPQRIYLKTARRLAAEGLACLRIDFPGVGDSPGPAPATHFDTYDPEHVSSALDFLAGRLGSVEFALLGLCAGGRVAFKAACRDRRISALVAWSVPLVSGPPEMPSPPGVETGISKTAALDQMRHWVPRILSPAAWWRYFASGQTLSQGLGRILPVLSGLLSRSPSRTGFLGQVDSFLASERPALLVYGAKDRAPLAELREHYPQLVEGGHPHCRFLLVSDGDHTFASCEAETQVIDATAAWLLDLAAE